MHALNFFQPNHFEKKTKLMIIKIKKSLNDCIFFSLPYRYNQYSKEEKTNMH